MMDKLLVATNNPGKVEELRALLARFPAVLVTPAEVGLDLRVVEDGSSYLENAGKKARAFAEGCGLISLADDSGLEVEALEGAPGLYSARYHPRAGATDAQRREYLVDNLRSKPRPWIARFRCAVAIAVPGGALQAVEGMCEGEIIPEERGEGGFGYDRIFLVAAAGRTMAQLDMEEKNHLSHRSRAILNARPILESLFGKI